MAGLPGFDASTLVCAGDCAGASEGQWSPASDVPELAPLALARGAAWSADAPASSFDLLDKLQIESAGLIGDDQYPSAAEVLFQDAEIKKSFAELLVSRTRTDDTEVRRLRGLVSELSVQLELMYRRIAQLENTHADFLGKLSRPDVAARPTQAPSAAAPALAPLAEPSIPASAAPFAPAPPAAPVEPAAAAFPTFAPKPVAAPPSRLAPMAAPMPTPEPMREIPAAQSPEVSASAPVPPPIEFPKNEDWPAAIVTAGIPPLSLPPSPEAAPVDVAPIPDIPALNFSSENILRGGAEAPQPPLPEVPGATLENSAIEREEVPLPPLPSLDAALASPLEPPAIATSEVASQPAAAPTPALPRRMVFDKPKTLRIVPTMRTLRVVSTTEGGSAPVDPEPQAPASAISAAPALSAPPAEPFSLPPMPDLSAVAPAAPVSVPAPEPAAEQVLPPLPTPEAFVPAPPPAVAPPSAEPPSSAPLPSAPGFSSPGAFPAAAFPSTGSIPAAAPAAGFSSPATGPVVPPSTAVFSGAPAFGSGADTPDAPPTQEVLARLAKPAAAPRTAPAPKPRGGGKTFMILGGVMVVALIILGVAFLRHSRDLKQMAALDDGKPPVGAEPIDETSRPASPKQPAAVAGAMAGGAAAPMSPLSGAPGVAAAPAVSGATAAPGVSGAPSNAAGPQAAVPTEASPAAPAPAPAPGPGDAAVAFVKDFPLDGGRGTVEKWLEFSYAATPDAGREVWNGSEQPDGTALVEYRFIPNVADAPKILYLFVADPAHGYVQGKNRDARDMLSGGGPRASAVGALPAKVKKATKRKSSKPRAPRRAASRVDAAPQEPAQLPLPSDGELHAPAEPDGDFGSDTVKSAP